MYKNPHPNKHGQSSSTSSLTPLMPVVKHDTSAMSDDNNNSGNMAEPQSPASGIPALPTRKNGGPKVFKKPPKVDMNPMPIPLVEKGRAGQVNGLSAEGRHGTDLDDPYLTPTEPPQYMDSSFQFANGNVSSYGDGDALKMRGARFQRFDSGVGDCESDPTSTSLRLSMSTSPSISSTGSTSLPRLSTHYEQPYEDIDKYYGSRKKDRSSINKLDGHMNQVEMNNIRPLPKVNVSGIRHSDSEDGDQISTSESHPRPMNLPISGTGTGTSSPHFYTQLDLAKHQSHFQFQKAKTRSGCCLLVVVLVLLFLISLASLSLSIYLLLSREDDNNVKMINVEPEPKNLQSSTYAETILRLQEEINGLKAENVALQQSIAQQKENFTAEIMPLGSEVQQLITSQEDINMYIKSVADTLSADIANISLTPGPQGASGVANFSLCEKMSRTKVDDASSRVPTRTGYHPDESVLKDKFVIFAFCSFEGATDAQLEVAEGQTDPAVYQYRCSCTGMVSNQDSTYCTVHYWLCPRQQ